MYFYCYGLFYSAQIVVNIIMFLCVSGILGFNNRWHLKNDHSMIGLFIKLMCDIGIVSSFWVLQ